MLVLITGAGTGFGAAIAQRLAADGAKLVLCGRRRDRLEQVQRALPAPAEALVCPFDIQDRRAAEAAIAGLPEGLREVDVLVNNAGLALGLEPAHRARLDDWEQMIATNVTGLARLTRLLLPGMVERGRGHIVNIGSIAAEFPYPGGNVYGATKAFVRQFSLNLRADLLGTGVRVTDIEPGLSGGTEFSNVRLRDDEKARQVYEGTQPLMPDDIAEAVRWVCRQPAHVNVNILQLMPTCQAFAPPAVHRER